MKEDLFIKEISNLGINLTSQQKDQLNKYYQLLKETNKITNLTTIIEQDEVYLKHFYDSIAITKIIDLNKIDSLCDIGTGAGFPGLVLKIVFPHIKLTLVDSTKKKTDFLSYVVESLNLSNVNVINERIEDFSRKNHEKYDVVTARALAKLNILLELSCQLIKINGYFIAMKSSCEEEIKSSKKALTALNMKIDNIITYNLPIEESKRNLIKIVKLCPIDNKYPRIFSKIKKFPL